MFTEPPAVLLDDRVTRYVSQVHTVLEAESQTEIVIDCRGWTFDFWDTPKDRSWSIGGGSDGCAHQGVDADFIVALLGFQEPIEEAATSDEAVDLIAFIIDQNVRV